MPVIWPRSSISILDQEAQLLMRKYGISFEDCLDERDHLLDRIARSGPHRDTLELVDSIRGHVRQTLDGIQSGLQELDSTLVPALENVRRKSDRNLARMDRRVRRVYMSGSVGSERDINWLLNRCRPHMNLQEREFTIWQLMAQYGPSVLEVIRESLTLEPFAHLLLCLESAE